MDSDWDTSSFHRFLSVSPTTFSEIVRNRLCRVGPARCGVWTGTRPARLVVKLRRARPVGGGRADVPASSWHPVQPPVEAADWPRSVSFRRIPSSVPRVRSRDKTSTGKRQVRPSRSVPSSVCEGLNGRHAALTDVPSGRLNQSLNFPGALHCRPLSELPTADRRRRLDARRRHQSAVGAGCRHQNQSLIISLVPFAPPPHTHTLGSMKLKPTSYWHLSFANSQTPIGSLLLLFCIYTNRGLCYSVSHVTTSYQPAAPLITMNSTMSRPMVGPVCKHFKQCSSNKGVNKKNTQS